MSNANRFTEADRQAQKELIRKLYRIHYAGTIVDLAPAPEQKPEESNDILKAIKAREEAAKG